ncbi:MAG: hypothetical protein IJR89_05245 [Clostridia bacterium]|nr:hypothetical protein [Clostridia bacterium]
MVRIRREGAGSSLTGAERARRSSNVYDLYFSETLLPPKNDFKKKLKRRTLRIPLIGSEYEEAVNRILPFCREKTAVLPFVAKDVFHWF